MDFSKVAAGAAKKTERKSTAGMIPAGSLIVQPLDGIKSMVKADEVRAAMDASMAAVKELVVTDQDSRKKIADIAIGAKNAAKQITLALQAIIQEPAARIKAATDYAKTFTDDAKEIERIAKQKESDFITMDRIRREREEAEKKKLAAEQNRKMAVDALRVIAQELGYASPAEIDEALAKKGLQPLTDDFPATFLYDEARAALVEGKDIAPEKAAEVVFEKAPEVNLPTQPETAQTVRTESGATSTEKMLWMWEITDATQVPEEYLIPPEERVARAKITAAVKSQGVRTIPGIRIFEKPSISYRG